MLTDTGNLDYGALATKLNMPPARMRRRIGHFEKVFRDTDIKGKKILEIGAGTGLVSCFLSMAGAESIVALEPEAAGSDSDAKAKFTSNVESLGLKNISLFTETIHNYNAPPHSFDIIVVIASINHLDEDACICLHKNEDAVKTYQELLKKIFNLLKPGGSIIITDCSRGNLFSWLSNKLGIPNPSAPMIEWFKHQKPQLWIKVLGSVGFKHATRRWIFPTWRIPGVCGCSGMDKFLDNFAFSYLTTSYFAVKAFRAD